MKSIFAKAVALGFLLVGYPVLAQPGPGRQNDAPPVVKKRIMRELGLNGDQIKKIEDLTYQADREKLDIHYEIQKARLDLQRLMSSDQPTEKAVFSLLEKISGLELKMKKNRLGLMLKIRKLLTREQWEKLELFQARRKLNQRRRHRRGNRPGIPNAPEAPEAPPDPAP